MVISVIGGSGSGKDTQAELLSQKFETRHISSGYIFREGEKQGNPLAIEAQKMANQGKWVTDNITSKLVLEYVQKNCPTGFIITGYPRYLEQAHTFDEIVKTLNISLTCVIHISVSDKILIERMKLQRAESLSRGDVRGDTSDEVIIQRLKSYHETINPLLTEYTTRNLLIDIDGSLPKEVVFSNILSSLSKLGIN